jgi:glyoxylase-like metal-dependent hydrolase (beta-lactamase superfamily II)
VLGEGSVFVAGDMADYLAGLRALRERGLGLICPGHGPPVLDPDAKLAEYIEHRLDRERRLLEALRDGVRGEDALLDNVWEDAPGQLRLAAWWTMNSHLRKLAAEGLLPDDVEAPPAPDIPAV